MSIKVTNTSPKVIGLGGMHVVQGQTITLPEGFGMDHPTVKFLIDRGWLTKVSAGGVLLTGTGNTDLEIPQTPLNPTDNNGGEQTEDDPANIGGGEQTEETGDGDPPENTGGENAENPTRSQIRRMNSEQLRNLATERGIAFESNATNAVLIDLILAAMPNADNGGQE